MTEQHFIHETFAVSNATLCLTSNLGRSHKRRTTEKSRNTALNVRKARKFTGFQQFLPVRPNYQSPADLHLPCSISDKHQQRDDDLLVIGVGQMRTGTTSLKHALQALYNKPCYHMSDLAFKLKQPHISNWIEAIKDLDETGRTGRLSKDSMFWRKMFQGYGCAVDYPSCLFYKELMHIYPRAKFILTIRDPVQWVQSCRATTLSKHMLQQPTLGERIARRLNASSDLPKLHNLMFAKALGKNFKSMTDEELQEALRNWNKSVISSIPAERLLILDIRSGWSPICDFLGVAMPKNQLKFPHMNKREEMKIRLSNFFHFVRVLDILIQCFILFTIVLLVLTFAHFAPFR